LTTVVHSGSIEGVLVLSVCITNTCSITFQQTLADIRTHYYAQQPADITNQLPSSCSHQTTQSSKAPSCQPAVPCSPASITLTARCKSDRVEVELPLSLRLKRIPSRLRSEYKQVRFLQTYLSWLISAITVLIRGIFGCLGLHQRVRSLRYWCVRPPTARPRCSMRFTYAQSIPERLMVGGRLPL
jgi:hypothetical protein